MERKRGEGWGYTPIRTSGNDAFIACCGLAAHEDFMAYPFQIHCASSARNFLQMRGTNFVSALGATFVLHLVPDNSPLTRVMRIMRNRLHYGE